MELTARATEVRSVATGGTHSCALLDTGAVVCWGDATRGALGVDTAATVLTPRQPVAGIPPMEQVVAGDDFTCGLTPAHQAWCWGLGDPAPRRLEPTKSLVSLAAGKGGSVLCGTDVDSHANCWFREGTGFGRGVPVRLENGLDQFIQISLEASIADFESYFISALTSDGQVGWTNGQLFPPWPDTIRLFLRDNWPVAVDTVVRIDGGLRYFCVMNAVARVYCLGRASPSIGWQEISPGQAVLQFGGGGGEVCAVTLYHQFYCDTPTTQAAGIRAGPDVEIKQFDTSSDLGCAVDLAGAAWCWGRNDHGELGNGLVGGSFPEGVRVVKDY